MRFEDIPADWSNLVICGVIVLSFTAWGLHSWLKKRPTPMENEKRRRQVLQTAGKMGDGMIVEIRDGSIFYSYAVRGVEYIASQDVSLLEASLPSDRWGIIGPVSVKYDPRNPANSIILSEHWTGLRGTRQELSRQELGPEEVSKAKLEQ